MIHGLRRTLVEGGKIKTGGKGPEMTSRDGVVFRPPVKYDYFVITTTNRDENGDYEVNNAVMTALIEQGWADPDGRIRQLPIALHSNDIEHVFPTALVCYQGKQLACRGDGKVAIRHEIVNGVRTGKTKEVECRCHLLDEGRCKHSGVLHCTLRLPDHGVIGSVYKWRTTSVISCSQMRGSLEDVILEAGALRGIPGLVLSIRPKKINRDGNLQTVYVCHVELREDVLVAQRAALEAAQMRKQLAAPGALGAIEASYVEVLEQPGEVDDEPDMEPGPEVVDADVEVITAPMAPAPAVEPPPQETKPMKRARRTKCKKCGQLFPPGIIKNGVCPDCLEAAPRQPELTEPQPAPQRPARPVTPGSSEERRSVVTAAMVSTIKRGVPSSAAMAALDKRWPDSYDRKWATDDEVAEALAILDALEPGNE